MSNQLSNETSPYLLQHADNPVEWYPWSDAAFASAVEQDKPVLLSVGYSACHWCHVMAHESFEDPATAELMNSLFVNIKVDREERPDVDKIYQVAHQLLTQRSGGWPLTMFLDPATQRPFFGGTYFPKDSRYGMPAFGELLQSVATWYHDRPTEMREQGDRLVEVLEKLNPAPVSDAVTLDATPLAAARETIAGTFDRDYGGFGGAPKFPHPTTIDRLLRHWRRTAHEAEPDLDALYMATLSLARMADGGIYDHLGGAFCRYSVDRYWQIPHFEKMLYDNGPLLALYAQAFLATGDTRFATTAQETADWILADMRAANGGFYATRDADSEGVEGKYYVWTPTQVEALLDADECAPFSQRYGLDQAANFEGEWHLTARKSVDEIGTDLDRTAADVTAAIDSARTKLLAERQTRVAPQRDEKQIVSWNGLAIRGLAIAGRALSREDVIDAAAGAVDFIEQNQFRDGRLLSVYKDGRARFSGYLDDYAFLIDGILELLQARWSTAHLSFATSLADTLLQHFNDSDAGGFWFTADDHETLMHRTKPLADEAVPSGNGVAACSLQRLGFLLGESRYLDAAEKTLRASWQALAEYPHGHVTLLNLLEEYLHDTEIIIIRGADDAIGEWRDSLARLYAPTRLVFAIPESAAGLPGALADRAPVPGKTLAYRCLGNHCEPPVASWQALATQISGI